MKLLVSKMRRRTSAESIPLSASADVLLGIFETIIYMARANIMPTLLPQIVQALKKLKITGTVYIYIYLLSETTTNPNNSLFSPTRLHSLPATPTAPTCSPTPRTATRTSSTCTTWTCRASARPLASRCPRGSTCRSRTRATRRAPPSAKTDQATTLLVPMRVRRPTSGRNSGHLATPLAPTIRTARRATGTRGSLFGEASRGEGSGLMA